MSRRFFLSYVRQGAAGGITDVDPLRGAMPRPPIISRAAGRARRRAGSRRSGAADQAHGSRRRASGFTASFVTRRYPEPGSIDSPANELPYIEFSRPDLPWMFTPASATPEHRLRPWIVLVVVPLSAELPERPAGVHFESRRRPSCRICRQSNAWAHAQVMAERRRRHRTQPSRAAARAPSHGSICPRRLDPAIAYHGVCRAGIRRDAETVVGRRPRRHRGTADLHVDGRFVHRSPGKTSRSWCCVSSRSSRRLCLGTRAVSAIRPWPTFKTLRALAGTPDDATPAIFQQDGALAAPNQSERPSLDEACTVSIPYANGRAREPPVRRCRPRRRGCTRGRSPRRSRERGLPAWRLRSTARIMPASARSTRRRSAGSRI